MVAPDRHLPLIFAHVTELLHYGPVFSQAHYHGLDGMPAHMRQWAEDTVRLLGRAFNRVAQGVVLIITTTSVQALLCARLASLLQVVTPVLGAAPPPLPLASNQLLVSRPSLDSKPHVRWLHSYSWLAFLWLHVLVIHDSTKTSQQQKKRGQSSWLWIFLLILIKVQVEHHFVFQSCSIFFSCIHSIWHPTTRLPRSIPTTKWIFSAKPLEPLQLSEPSFCL